MKITVTGYSDDNIEIEGDIEEEFAVSEQQADAGVCLAVSDGTLLRIIYDDDGIWRVTPAWLGTAHYSKIEGDVQSDTFDKVTLEGDGIKWVALANADKCVLHQEAK